MLVSVATSILLIQHALAALTKSIYDQLMDMNYLASASLKYTNWGLCLEKVLISPERNDSHKIPLNLRYNVLCIETGK
jgi:hypothetical protein